MRRFYTKQRDSENNQRTFAHYRRKDGWSVEEIYALINGESVLIATISMCSKEGEAFANYTNELTGETQEIGVWNN